MVNAAQDFVSEEHLVALAGETVVAAPHVGLATRFDMLCERLYGDRAGRMVLVSWKTSGDCPFETTARRVSITARVCRAIEDNTPSEFVVAREHLAQLALELHMVRNEHQVDVQEACIVYLTPGKREHRVVWLDDASISGQGYERVWEYITALRQ